MMNDGVLGERSRLGEAVEEKQEVVLDHDSQCGGYSGVFVGGQFLQQQQFQFTVTEMPKHGSFSGAMGRMVILLTTVMPTL